jgi:hypothetical protein
VKRDEGVADDLRHVVDAAGVRPVRVVYGGKGQALDLLGKLAGV